jgi:hypothetical protein
MNVRNSTERKNVLLQTLQTAKQLNVNNHVRSAWMSKENKNPQNPEGVQYQNHFTPPHLGFFYKNTIYTEHSNLFLENIFLSSISLYFTLTYR